MLKKHLSRCITCLEEPAILVCLMNNLPNISKISKMQSKRASKRWCSQNLMTSISKKLIKIRVNLILAVLTTSKMKIQDFQESKLHKITVTINGHQLRRNPTFNGHLEQMKILNQTLGKIWGRDIYNLWKVEMIIISKGSIKIRTSIKRRNKILSGLLSRRLNQSRGSGTNNHRDNSPHSRIEHKTLGIKTWLRIISTSIRSKSSPNNRILLGLLMSRDHMWSIMVHQQREIQGKINLLSKSRNTTERQDLKLGQGHLLPSSIQETHQAENPKYRFSESIFV